MIKRNSASIAVLASGIAVAFALTGCVTEDLTPLQDNAVVQDDSVVQDGGALEIGEGFQNTWADLPKDWPVGIPLVSEQITGSTYGADPDGEDWTVDILPVDIDAEFAAARAQLTSAGFTEESWDSTEGTFHSDTHQIVLSLAVGDYGDDVIRYFVTPL